MRRHKHGGALVGRWVLALLASAMATSLTVASAIARPDPHRPNIADEPCLIALDAVSSPVPKFDAFPAETAWTGRPARVDLKSDPSAAKFRTVLREGARTGPNFAGHYTMVGWGCGASCLSWAVVDANTGKVHFERKIEVVSAVHVSDLGKQSAGMNAEYNALRFRRDSKLLAVLGAPNEDEARDGIAFYRWDGDRFNLVKFVRRADACRVVR